MSVTIPAGVVPGGQFQAITPSGGQMLVTCPQGSKSGDQLQVMAPAAPPTCDDAAVEQYERWLAAASRISIRDKPHLEGVKRTVALDNKTDTLLLVLTETEGVEDFAGNAELRLSDGRAVMKMNNLDWKNGGVVQPGQGAD